MTKRRFILPGVLVGSLLAILVWLIYPNETLMARAERMDYVVTVKRIDDCRYRTELVFNNRFVVTSYEFYGGSTPFQKAVIEWPELNNIVVRFDDGAEFVKLSWGDYKAYWETSGARRNKIAISD